MLLKTVALLSGLVVLAFGSDRFVAAAAAFARNLGVSAMVIGLTVVALGTSTPEMLVSTVAAWAGNPGIALGNVLGSNIANIALVVGASAVAAPMVVASQTLRREFPLLFAASALAWLLAADGHLARADAGMLTLALLGAVALIVRTARQARRSDPLRRELDAQPARPMATGLALLWMLAGLGTMLVGSELVVWGATGIARAFGVSDLVIGLTIVAVGTSTPELAASAASALRGESDIAIGNVLGSSIFNLLPVIGVAALVEPFQVERAALHRDFPIMVGLTVVFFLMCVGRRGAGRVSRANGAVLLAVFVGYQSALYVTAR